MKKLTDKQKSYLLEYFFKNEHFPGWKNIATSLLEKGKCIVAGKECIWKGGIGNFIKTKEEESLFDCLEYEFDLDLFLSSEWCKEIANLHISDLLEKKLELEQKYKEICDLIPQQN